jgi:uncharacterized protein
MECSFARTLSIVTTGEVTTANCYIPSGNTQRWRICLPLQIWIDADAAPREVKEIVFRAAKRLKIATYLVANQSHYTPPGADYIRSIAVKDGANVADGFIVTHSQANDLVITADIPLAALLVDKGVCVVDPRGEQYTADNIRTRLSIRDYLDQARGAGEIRSGSPPYGDRDKAAFASTFDRLLVRQLKLDAKTQSP